MAKSNRKPAWDSRQTAAENAQRTLPSTAERFFQAGRDIAKVDISLDRLHRFRLKVKRFRYSLELFQPCYGPGLKQRLNALKKIQDFLGDINDCETTRGLMRDAALGHLPEQQPFQKFLAARAEERRAEFVKYWREDFDGQGRLRWWTDYLKRSASLKGKRK